MPSNRYPIIAREAWPLLFLLSGLALLAQFLVGPAAFGVLILPLIAALFLFRDPARAIPASPLAVVSPVHGVVTLVEETEETRLKTRMRRIRLSMRPHDIYSLRSPIEGKVMQQWCDRMEANDATRRMDFYIQSDEGDRLLMAIRHRHAMPRFHLYLRSGERVGQGQRCGYLYFGALIDVFLPLDCKVLVEVGQNVNSGSSVLARLIHAEGATVIGNSTTMIGSGA